MNASIFYLNWSLLTQEEGTTRNAVCDIISGLDAPTVADVTGSRLYDKVGDLDLGNELVYEKVDGGLIPIDALEAIYHDLQNGIGKGTQEVLGTARRSMSVGDVVRINNGWYVVAGCGFKAVN